MSDDSLEPLFPIEFLVPGTPASVQTKRSATRTEWQARVKAASRSVLSEGYWASRDRMSATLFYFPSGRMSGDIDNIVKLTLDALKQHVYMDDSQIERVLIQKFEPEIDFRFVAPSSVLARAVDHPRPVLYIRISSDPFEDLR